MLPLQKPDGAKHSPGGVLHVAPPQGRHCACAEHRPLAQGVFVAFWVYWHFTPSHMPAGS